MSLHQPREAQNVKMYETLVVEGGRLKKPWVPDFMAVRSGEEEVCLKVDGKPFIALSSDDYKLAQFLFGTVNKRSDGRHARNLPSTKIVRRLWKARNQAQDEAMARLQGGAARPTRDADALTALFGAEPAGEVYSRLEKRRAVSKKALFAQLPNHFEVEVPSAQAGVNSVSFAVARDKPECLVAVQAPKQSLMTTLLEEVTAERTGTEDEEPGSPRTPPRRPGKRRTHPFASSHGSGQSPGSRGGRKRARRPESHFDKDRGRVVARWREADGSRNHRLESYLEDPADDKEKRRVRTRMLDYARSKRVPVPS